MAQTASDATLAWVFDEPVSANDGLSDPFAEGDVVAPAKPRSRRKPVATVTDAPTAGDSGDSYTFRFDVEVTLAERGKCGAKFMKQWKRVLQAQKLSPLVSPKLVPQGARFQLCMTSGDVGAALVAEREREIAEELAHLRRDALPVLGEPAGTHPAGWQGVRVWMTFDRQDVETAFAKKPKL